MYEGQKGSPEWRGEALRSAGSCVPECYPATLQRSSTAVAWPSVIAKFEPLTSVTYVGILVWLTEGLAWCCS